MELQDYKKDWEKIQEEKPKTNIDELISLLGYNKMYVSFEKKDGTLRQMLATKSLELVPSDKQPKKNDKNSENTQNKKTNENVVVVFDLDKNEWRSFRKDSIKDYQTLATVYSPE